MKLKGILVSTAFVIFAAVALAQTGEEYVDKSGKFKLTLVGDWKAVNYEDAVGRRRSEFVYRDRSEGLLKITRESLNGVSLADLVRQEEQNMRTYRAGFESAASEAFGGGGLRGMRFAFYNTDGGRKAAGTYYYLEDGNSVWVLKFTGRRGSLDTIRNLTDQIARSFRPM
ncbi:MAG TPA: hypothetical protein VJQ56_02835 [Blastocatellia bacterium]|nr:hypothetical protein [Blastocatellia bacterium]